jgi:CheY-like chemotaxis protein
VSATAPYAGSFSGFPCFKSDTGPTTLATSTYAPLICLCGEATLKVQPVHTPVPLNASRNGTRSILSVDDEPGILFTRRAILENAGFKVLSAADGEQALQIFGTEPIDLVLLDYVMPGLNGGAVARKIKIAKPQVPVIIVSASPVEEDFLSCVDCLISKGQGPGVLLEKIEQLLARL